jgi:hypothetical protein
MNDLIYRINKKTGAIELVSLEAALESLVGEDWYADYEWERSELLAGVVMDRPGYQYQNWPPWLPGIPSVQERK